MSEWKSRLWEPPSDRTAALIRQGVEALLENPGDLLAQLDAATFDANRELLRLEPRLADAFRAATRSNFAHWATATLREPGTPVTANLGPENTNLVRDIVRHGFDETILAGFRASQNVAIETWHAMAFHLTDDTCELQELIPAVTRSIFAFIDDTLEGLDALIRRERTQLTDATHVARLEVVTLILEGAPISKLRASERLRYDLERQHTAGVVWSDSKVAPAELEEVVNALARAAGAQRPLSILASPSSMWIWVSGKHVPNVGEMREAWDDVGDVRVTLGRTQPDLEGFRASHLEAITTQRLVRRLTVPSAITTYDDIEVVSLATHDESRANEFVTRTLGQLASAPPELRETLLVFLREQCSPTRTARAMFAHRNTVIGRLDRARDLLPDGLDGHIIPIGLALEMLAVLGPSKPT